MTSKDEKNKKEVDTSTSMSERLLKRLDGDVGHIDKNVRSILDCISQVSSDELLSIEDVVNWLQLEMENCGVLNEFQNLSDHNIVRLKWHLKPHLTILLNLKQLDAPVRKDYEQNYSTYGNFAVTREEIIGVIIEKLRECTQIDNNMDDE